MAFFTRLSLNVPVLPPEENNSEGVPLLQSHRRHASEPSTSSAKSSSGTNSISLAPSTRSRCASQTGGAIRKTPTDAKPENEQTCEEKTNEDEPKRYEYVVDRVLGVEV